MRADEDTGQTWTRTWTGQDHDIKLPRWNHREPVLDWMQPSTETKNLKELRQGIRHKIIVGLLPTVSPFGFQSINHLGQMTSARERSESNATTFSSSEEMYDLSQEIALAIQYYHKTTWRQAPPYNRHGETIHQWARKAEDSQRQSIKASDYLAKERRICRTSTPELLITKLI